MTRDEYMARLSYDVKSGEFRWKHGFGRRYVGGKIAGSLDRLGYRRICASGKKCAAHQLAWLFFYGDWPDGEIDHINGNRDDNRLANLRVVNRSINMHNHHGKRKNNSSGYHGCFKVKGYDRWRAEIIVNGERIYLGLHPTPELAGAAYAEAKARLNPEQLLK